MALEIGTRRYVLKRSVCTPSRYTLGTEMMMRSFNPNFLWNLLVSVILHTCIEAFSGFGRVVKKNNNNFKARDALHLSISSFDYETQNKLPWLQSGYKVGIINITCSIISFLFTVFAIT